MPVDGVETGHVDHRSQVTGYNQLTFSWHDSHLLFLLCVLRYTISYLFFRFFLTRQVGENVEQVSQSFYIIMRLKRKKKLPNSAKCPFIYFFRLRSALHALALSELVFVKRLTPRTWPQLIWLIKCRKPWFLLRPGHDPLDFSLCSPWG